MVDVVAVTRLTEDDCRRVRAVDPRVNLIDAGSWFDSEIAATWPAQTARMYLGRNDPEPARSERDAALAKAEIIVHGFPYPLDLRARSPRLKWAHQRNAGANNLWRGDLWRSDVTVTTSRGEVAAEAIAEYAVAGLLHAARDFNQAERDRASGTMDRRTHRPMVLAGKTAAIVGAGGIGRIAGRLLAGLGMTVLGVRHTTRRGDPLPDGFVEMHGHDALLQVLARSHAAVVACQLTKDTEKLMGAAAFAAIQPGAVLVNVARGEIVDEDALLAALDSGQLRGAVLDVYCGEFDGPPPPRLWNHPNILITPHNSGAGMGAGARAPSGVGIRIFCENLRAYLDGRPLANVIDWERGY